MSGSLFASFPPFCNFVHHSTTSAKIDWTDERPDERPDECPDERPDELRGALRRPSPGQTVSCKTRRRCPPRRWTTTWRRWPSPSEARSRSCGGRTPSPCPKQSKESPTECPPSGCKERSSPGLPPSRTI